MFVRVCIVVLATLHIAVEAKVNGSQQDQHQPAIYDAFHKGFSKLGLTAEQIDKLLLEYYKEGIDMKKWPFTDCGKELLASVNNKANTNRDKIMEAIRLSGGDLNDLSSFTPKVCGSAQNILTNSASGPASLLETGTPTMYEMMYLERAISMTQGSVASNSAAAKGLEAVVANNLVQIGELSSTVSSLSTVTQPTVILAEALGLPIASVASMSLAGAFIGPLLGVVAIVYAAWPQEEVDPWLKVESRVAQMISEKFDAHRRKTLGDRLRRYIKQFSRCSQAWVADGLVQFEGVSLPKHIVEEGVRISSNSKPTKGGDNDDFDVSQPDNDFSMSFGSNFPAPPCTAELEAHMSLERDEWFKTENGQMSGLFMPFANMHTQLQSMLTDHPYDESMRWGDSLKSTAAEYGSYMLSHLISAWKAQTCRTMRLRQSMKSGQWAYQLIVMKAVEQPNAAETCNDKCGGKSGWCNFCGGTNEGACCRQGDGGVCSLFDVPVGWRGGVYPACVHTDCIQKNTGYYGTELKSFGEKSGCGSTGRCGPWNKEDCQAECSAVPGAKVFTVTGGKCTCLSEAKRHKEVGAYSGPVVCKLAESSIAKFEEKLEGHLNETLKVPIEEVEPCSEKSQPASNFADVETNQGAWVSSCLKASTQVVVQEYNTFYQRFAKFVDDQAWKAGCGTQHEASWEYTGALGNGMEVVSEAFDGGSFGDCDWQKQEEKDKNMWVFDEERARGWTGTSKVVPEEQKKMKTMYPMPSWLRDLRNVHDCLRVTAGGNTPSAQAGGNNGVSTSIDEVLGSTAMEDSTTSSADEDAQYDEMLCTAEGGQWAAGSCSTDQQ